MDYVLRYFVRSEIAHDNMFQSEYKDKNTVPSKRQRLKQFCYGLGRRVTSENHLRSQDD